MQPCGDDEGGGISSWYGPAAYTCGKRQGHLASADAALAAALAAALSAAAAAVAACSADLC